MAWVILFRGANVGGRIFRPSELVKSLPKLELTSFGAAGTFVARTAAAPDAIRQELRSKLPFDPPMMFVPGEELLRILRADPIGGARMVPGVRRFVTVAGDPLSKAVRLPIEVPGPTNWEVQVLVTDGPFALGIRRRIGPRLIYPNDVVQRAFGVEATTRWWETLESVGRSLGLRGGPSAKMVT